MFDFKPELEMQSRKYATVPARATSAICCSVREAHTTCPHTHSALVSLTRFNRKQSRIASNLIGFISNCMRVCVCVCVYVLVSMYVYAKGWLWRQVVSLVERGLIRWTETDLYAEPWAFFTPTTATLHLPHQHFPASPVLCNTYTHTQRQTARSRSGKSDLNR